MSDLDLQIAELQQSLAQEHERNRQLEEQFKYRVGAFVKRESLARKTVEALERKLQGPSSAEEEHRQRMGLIRNMHDSVIGGLACIQGNTSKILQDQEKDLMRAFRARLQDVSKDLESHRSKKGDFSAELQARHRRVVAELHASQELAHIFDRKNQQLLQENAQLQEWLKRRVDDRAAMVKDLVVTRRENARLKASVGKKARVEVPTEQPETKSVEQKIASRNLPYERELKLREQVKKARKELRSVQRESASWREAQKRHIAQRAELEVFLRHCMDDVQRELNAARERDGEEALQLQEVLEAQERVVHLVYGKCFPHRPPSPPRTPPLESTMLSDSLADLLGEVEELPPI